MSIFTSSPSRLKAGVGIGITALIVLAATAVGTGTASANSRWIVGFENASINSNAHSIQYNKSCYLVDRSGPFTIPADNDGVSRVLLTGGAEFTVQTFLGTNCNGGGASDRVTFTIPVNYDRSRVGLDCTEIILKPQNLRISDPIFLNCR